MTPIYQQSLHLLSIEIANHDLSTCLASIDEARVVDQGTMLTTLPIACVLATMGSSSLACAGSWMVRPFLFLVCC
jgi:hypothetical protein